MLSPKWSPLRHRQFMSEKDYFFLSTMTKFTVKEPESGLMLTLEMYKVDTPTGAGWHVTLPDERNLLIKFLNREWKADNEISHEFAQAIGNEINLLVEADKPGNNCGKNYAALNQRPKRAILL